MAANLLKSDAADVDTVTVIDNVDSSIDAVAPAAV